MPSWVSATPPLAGADYVHFTPKGARKVAELFYKSLYNDFTQALQGRVPEAVEETTDSTAPVQ
jgi:hypothetical protein